MNNTLKLALPIGLGLAAGALNFAFMRAKGAIEHDEYVQVTRSVAAGSDVFAEDMFTKVELPTTKGAQVNALPWDKRSLVYGRTIPRDFQKGDVVLLSDIQAERVDLDLETNETALMISLADLQIEPGLLAVGRQVGFIVRASLAETDFADETDDSFGNETFSDAGERLEQIGPFRIVSVGARIEKDPISFGEHHARNSTAKSATISVATELVDGHYLDAAAQRLIEASANGALMSVTLHRFD